MKINLFLFPFAGGSIYSYTKYKEVAPPQLKLIPLELPGRGKRLNQPLLTSSDAMVEDLFNQIKPLLNEPYAFYGHSMGTLLAYLVTKRIIREGLNPPVYLFMTGRFGPAAEDPDPPNHSLPKEAFRKKLKEMGGSPDELLADEALMDFFEPFLRADFQAIEEYRYEPTEPFDIPILACIGKEERITHDLAMTWQKETTRPVEIRWFSGPHFFIFNHAPEIMRLMAQRLHTVAV
jgi:surfactin synthase thioesterase subunit